MSVAVAERKAGSIERPQRDTPALFDDGVTLEDLVLRVWEDLVDEGRATCLVCGGSMSPAAGCESCGSELS
jgi:hypothetical protein